MRGVSHWLPDIDIAADLASRACLVRMAEIGRTSGRFEVEAYKDVLGVKGLDIVNFRPRQAQAHLDLGVQLISQAPDLRRLEVELRAARWTPDPPTTEIYVEAARALVRPLLAAYNRAYGTRLRLRVERVSRDAFRLTARTSALFDRFAALANSRALHPLDWRRFYQLVRDSRQFPRPACARC